MMDNKEISPLGFSIPTYRRPALLNIALESIVPQAREIGAPVYIPDNSCDDTNVSVVSKWRQEYRNVIHDVNSNNVGIDRNVDKAISNCPASYVHVIGDDDIIFPGFAERVSSLLSMSAPGHIFCPYIYLSNDYRPRSGASFIPPAMHQTSLRRFLPQYGWTLGFIGAHVFCRSRFIECEKEGFGSYFHHLARLIGYVDPDETLYVVDEPLVGNRADDESTATWSADRLNVVFGLEKSLVRAMQERYSQADIRHTVETARQKLGYSEFFRLVYWAALAERSGEAAKYWSTLSNLVSPGRYKRLRSVPRFSYSALISVIPYVRRLKRFARGSGIDRT